PRTRGSGQLQQHRIEAGEPSESSGEIHFFKEGFSSMSFQVYQQVGLSGPFGEGLQKSAQEHIIDLSVVDGGYLLKKNPSLLPLRPHPHQLMRGPRVAPLRIVHRYRADRQACFPPPVSQFLSQRLRLSILLESLCPPLEGGGFGGKGERFS